MAKHKKLGIPYSTYMQKIGTCSLKKKEKTTENTEEVTVCTVEGEDVHKDVVSTDFTDTESLYENSSGANTALLDEDGSDKDSTPTKTSSIGAETQRLMIEMALKSQRIWPMAANYRCTG